MKRTVSLFEFMPYGAPELLAAGRSHLARALFVSSAAPVILFLVLLPVVPMLRPLVLPEPVRPPTYDLYPPPPVYVPPPPAATPPSGPPSASREPAIPIPIPDVEVPPDVPTAPPRDDVGVVGQPNANTDRTPALPTSPPREVLPDRGEIVVVDVLPAVVKPFKPDYPPFAREAGVDGTVLVHALIGRDGRVVRVELDPKYSIPMLDQTALEAAKRWVFTPATTNGHPVAVWFAIPFKFVLHE